MPDAFVDIIVMERKRIVKLIIVVFESSTNFVNYKFKVFAF